MKKDKAITILLRASARWQAAQAKADAALRRFKKAAERVHLIDVKGQRFLMGPGHEMKRFA